MSINYYSLALSSRGNSFILTKYTSFNNTDSCIFIKIYSADGKLSKQHYSNYSKINKIVEENLEDINECLKKEYPEINPYFAKIIDCKTY